MLFAAEGLSDHGLELVGGGIIAVALLKIVLDFLSKKKDNGEHGAVCALCRAQISDLHVWHAPDAHGEQQWKNARMIELVGNMNKLVAHNTEALRELKEVVKDLKREVSDAST